MHRACPVRCGCERHVTCPICANATVPVVDLDPPLGEQLGANAQTFDRSRTDTAVYLLR
jgi:hypothetical protein